MSKLKLNLREKVTATLKLRLREAVIEHLKPIQEKVCTIYRETKPIWKNVIQKVPKALAVSNRTLRKGDEKNWIYSKAF